MVLHWLFSQRKIPKKKIRDILSKLYTERGTESMLGSAEDGDYYPYVSLNVDLSDMM